MLLGIDVGGTFTDAVLLDGALPVKMAKVPTTHENILEGIVHVLDKVLVGQRAEDISRAVISSTIVTNSLAENKLPPAFLAVIPGPGMNVENAFPVKPYILSGCVDHRGKITAGIDWNKHKDLFDHVTPCSAVSCKFAVREPQLENLLVYELSKHGAGKVYAGAQLSGELNFLRRTNSAYFSAQVYGVFVAFLEKVLAALKVRKITCPIHILKADGGTIPLLAALNEPIEAIFTGPAASVLGIEALATPEKNAISLDIGGTTTDIAFWENGKPLMARRGASINNYPTAVRAFHMRSIGIGGDSCIHKLECGDYVVGPKRAGVCAALGGKEATLSDALIVAGYVEFGNRAKSHAALKKFGEDTLCEARKIVSAAVQKISATIQEMLVEYAKQPVYTVDDIVHEHIFQPEVLIGVGGGSLGLVKALGEAMNLQVNIPQGAVVANAIGAAVARPTMSAGLRTDTTDGFYIIPECGKKNRLPSGFDKNTAISLVKNFLLDATKDWQLSDRETELISYEHFYCIHDYYESGDIISLRMQLKPGILCKVEGREVAFDD
ncbi:MAG: hydantoinase/oxoprolinase family protein [Phascolarctobacterium sp.]|nr:hydantoinase/oxoprolinase family protein [Phascolarctobacterium sp.]